MVEIALCIAVVAFALVAILGVMPTGLQVQKDNREDTIIIRTGPSGSNAPERSQRDGRIDQLRRSHHHQAD